MLPEQTGAQTAPNPHDAGIAGRAVRTPIRPDPHGQGLQRFRTAKAGEIARLTALNAAGRLPAPFRGPRPSFRAALRTRPDGLPAVIAEYKRASPSAGAIAPDLLPEDVARQYAESGAACLSVLTEEAYFRGDPAFLARMAGLPLLRKDFLFHPLQIAETAATPASALLLIVRLTPDVALLRRLREEAEAFGLDAVVEVFDAADLALARAAGSRIIQVNARDLESFAVDRAACLRLADAFRHDANGREEIWIAASGLERREHLTAAADAGFDAVLLGTALMRGGRPGEALRALLDADVQTPPDKAQANKAQTGREGTSCPAR